MKKMLLLSIVLCISTTTTPKKILIIEGVQYGAYFPKQGVYSSIVYENKPRLTNVTDKFFNRKNNTNWMNDTFGDPVEGTTKELHIEYRKLNTSKLRDTLNNTLVAPILTFDIREKTGINNLIENPNAHINDSAPIINPISYAIENVTYGSKKNGKFRNVTDKFTNRPNDTNWMNETFGDPYPDKKKILYFTYRVINEEDYNNLINNLGKESPLLTLDLKERQGIDGL